MSKWREKKEKPLVPAETRDNYVSAAAKDVMRTTNA